nr:ricin-type beta-trefoil lectin domain protein [Streptomyces tendae]
MQIYACNGSAAQRWTVPADGTLRALGKCLDVSGGGVRTGRGAVVDVQRDCCAGVVGAVGRHGP